MAARVIGIVDDDQSVRESISSLIRSAGYASILYESAEALLNSGRLHDAECLILDVGMPGMDGLELQRRLSRHNGRIPVIFVSAHAEEAIRTTAVEQGAIAFLTKPFSATALLDALEFALQD
jgi:FixJ family two-component response regulator